MHTRGSRSNVAFTLSETDPNFAPRVAQVRVRRPGGGDGDPGDPERPAVECDPTTWCAHRARRRMCARSPHRQCVPNCPGQLRLVDPRRPLIPPLGQHSRGDAASRQDSRGDRIGVRCGQRLRERGPAPWPRRAVAAVRSQALCPPAGIPSPIPHGPGFRRAGVSGWPVKLNYPRRAGPSPPGFGRGAAGNTVQGQGQAERGDVAAAIASSSGTASPGRRRRSRTTSRQMSRIFPIALSAPACMPSTARTSRATASPR